eukprot:3874078-Amphidinium_carterae.1
MVAALSKVVSEACIIFPIDVELVALQNKLVEEIAGQKTSQSVKVVMEQCEFFLQCSDDKVIEEIQKLLESVASVPALQQQLLPGTQVVEKMQKIVVQKYLAVLAGGQNKDVWHCFPQTIEELGR